jgi:myo-inositol 2-dehydrogenase/D-chiro-inositol 1-dehydrogenase
LDNLSTEYEFNEQLFSRRQRPDRHRRPGPPRPSARREPRRAARDALGIERLYDTYEGLLADPEVDAVFLVTPTSLHPDQIIAALHAGKHVFCEKPLSLELEACERVVAEAKRFPHLKTLIGFVRRFDPSYRDAFEKVRGGRIGKPFMVRSQTCDKNDPDGFFVRFAPTSGGIFLDCSVHDIDLARWLLGNPKPVRAYATGTIALHPGLADSNDVDNGVAIVEFEGGKLAVFYASRTMAHGHDTTTEVIGTAGALYERFADAFVTEAQVFVDAVRGDEPLPLTLQDALEATRIGIALRESQQSGQAVTFEPATALA